MSDWLERCDWKRRSPEFGDLVYGIDVTMRFGATLTIPDRLWRLWLDIPRHPNILTAKTAGTLSYAAIDWDRGPTDNVSVLARCGVDLVRAYEFMFRRVDRAYLGWLTAPIVKLDLEGVVRIAFADPSTRRDQVPPEIFDSWPNCTERALVNVVGQALRALAIPGTAVDPVIEQCVGRDPGHRHAKLDAVHWALANASRPNLPPAWREARLTWDCIEKGLGYIAVGALGPAFRVLEDAHHQEPKSTLARELFEHVDRLLTAQAPPMTWSAALAKGAELERERDFAAALALYRRVPRESADEAALDVAHARCLLALGDPVYALTFAERAPAAYSVRVDALLRLFRHADALVATDAWLAAEPDEASAHYARGKSLLALGRLPEARDAFDRACTLRPQLLEAMVLRREVDRAQSNAAASVGSAAPMKVAIPDHLAELRDVLITGRTIDGIQLLRRPIYDRDPIAQRLLGELLSYEHRYTDAIDAFDRASEDPAAVVGKARALLELGRVADALALFESSTLDEALEGAARALRALGRAAEADAMFARYVAAIGRRAELRVGSLS